MKKTASMIMAMFLMLTLLAVPEQTVYGADLTISTKSQTVNIGDTITVTVAVPENVTASIDVSYPSDLVKFTGCNITASDSGSALSMTMGIYAPQSPKSATITFSATAAGTATFSATSIKAGAELGDEVVLGGVSTSVAIENKASEEQPVVLSNDNSLKTLQISSGTLSPAFQPDTTNYKATVSYDVTKVSVSAVPAHEKAKIATVSGGTNLQVGQNTINVLVQAENGVTREYKIVVTRQQQTTQQPENPDNPNTQTPDESKPDDSEPISGIELSWNGSKLKFVEEIPKNVIPADFEKTTRMINNKEVSVLDFKNGKLTVAYLSNEEKENGLYIYDSNAQDVYPFVSLGDEENYVIVLRPDDTSVPDGYVACTLSIEGKGVVSAYQFYSEDVASLPAESRFSMFGAEVFFAAEPSASDFYLMYCMNANGQKCWYLYDVREETFQRYASALYQVKGETTPEPETGVETPNANYELEHAKKMQNLIIIVAAVVVVILLIIIIVLAIKLASRSIDDEFEDEIEMPVAKIKEDIKKEDIKKEEAPARAVKQIPDLDDEASDLEFIDLD